MQVFKLVFKLLKENKISILVTVIVAIGISILFVKTGANSATTTFNEDVKPSIVVIDQSKSEQSKAVQEFLDEKTQIVDLQEEEIEDALFYQQIVYVLYIPEGYETSLMSGDAVHLEKKTVPNVAGAYLVDQYVQEYLTATQNYVEYMPDATFAEIDAYVKADFEKEVKVEVKQSKAKEQVQMYFNFFGYSLVCSIITGIGYAMSRLSQKELKRRNTVSPMKHFTMTMQQVLAYICFAFAMFLIAVLFAYLIFYEGMQEDYAIYMILNLAVYLIPCLGIAFLIGTLVHSLDVQNGIANVLGLAMAFLGGSFVPQSLLSDGLLKIAAFTPNYWFVKANETLFSTRQFTWDTLQPVVGYMGVQILFGVAFIFIALLYSKQKRKNVV